MSTALSRARDRLAERLAARKAAKLAYTDAKAAVVTTRRTIRRLQRKQGPAAAIAYAAKHVGHTEAPPGTNRSSLIDRWAAAFTTARGFAWCGAFSGYCLRQAKVQGITDRVLFVPFIIFDAKAGRNGFARFVAPQDIQPGDLVCMDFGGSPTLGEHVGLAVAAFKDGTVQTIEGNTSSGTAGSQSNGGGVFRRSRPASVIVGGARPSWPK